MRRTKPEPREIQPDIRYHNSYVSQLIHHMLQSGKKSTAVGIMYDALDIIQEKTGKHPIEVLETALKNVGPIMEVRPRRVGGATYQVPWKFPWNAALPWRCAGSWMQRFSGSGKSFAEKLSVN